MLLYSIVGTLEDWEKLEPESKEAEERTNSLRTATEEFNLPNAGRCHISVSTVDYRKSEGVLCAAVKEGYLDAKTVEDFMSTIGFKLSKYEIKEVTASEFKYTLRISDRNNYIKDEDEVLESLKIDNLYSRERFFFKETVLTKLFTKEDSKEMAGALLSHNTLSPELDRIYIGSAVQNAIGHPVHYFMQSDDSNFKNQILELLLTALYRNNRIKSRRYSEIDFFDEHNSPSERKIKMLYESCRGGTVVASFRNNDSVGDEYANSSLGDIIALCNVMKLFRNDVLTVISLPRSCDGIKNIFYEYLGSTTMVQLREDTAFGNQAKAYLRNLTKKYGIKGNRALYDPIADEEKGYTSSDLNKIFDEWYSKQMKSRIYTQYSELDSANKQIVKQKAKGSAIDDLTNMIGLTSAKEIIQQALDFYKAQKLFREKGFSSERPAMHMVFTGNPGTAKTTVARLFAQILKDNNLLSVGSLYEVSRADLVGKYVGWTATIVKKKFKAAKGSVLFIDEAYSLVDDRDGLFGDEAINAIVQEMENYREDIVVIFAGYPDKMEGFLNKNPGLRSRIAFHVPFADYNAGELYQITELLAQKKELKLCDDVQEKLLPIFETAMKNGDFGNGRYARNMLEKAILRQASRLISMDVDEVTAADIEMLTADDFEAPHVKVDKKIKIGFAI